MTRRREIENKLALYGELEGIIGAMKSFAMVELKRITSREAAGRTAMDIVSMAMADMAPAMPQIKPPEHNVWLLFGSARGFCGSLNEDVHAEWLKHDSPSHTIIVGERLAALLPENENNTAIAGAIGVLDAVTTIDAIVESFAAICDAKGCKAGLMAALRDENGVIVRQVLPWPALKGGRQLPLTNEPAFMVAENLARHYLYHTLMSLLLSSIRTENHLRLMQMENAMMHLEHGAEDLRRLRNRLRQEEIVEEIELIASSATM